MQPLDQSDDDWTAVIRNIRKERKFWGIIGGILRREWEYNLTYAAFYRAVLQVVLLFRAETWVL